MAKLTLRPFKLRLHDQEGLWLSNHGRYRNYAHALLADHLALCGEIQQKWPVEPGAAITDPSTYPEVDALVHRRNQTADTVRIYSAMAVEGYLNFYGVLRLGQEVFDEHFERLGLVPKLRTLLLICDQLQVQKSDPLVIALESVAASRNSLVHPKTKEVVGGPAQHNQSTSPVPETARAAVRDMEAFFKAFLETVPKAVNHLPCHAADKTE